MMLDTKTQLRLKNKIAKGKQDECWLFTGCLDEYGDSPGYGMLILPGGRTAWAHL